MADTCSHLDTIIDAPPSDDGCTDCLRIGGQWMHLRRCAECGHVGCCDNSPHRHATAHFRETGRLNRRPEFWVRSVSQLRR